jgi:excisionase family DNA binding protein
MIPPLPTPDALDDVRLLTIPAAAALLAVSENTVRRMMRAGELRPVPVWGKQRIPLTELRAYLARQSDPVLIPTAIGPTLGRTRRGAGRV